MGRPRPYDTAEKKAQRALIERWREEGARAFRKGRPPTRNPYSKSSSAFFEWLVGYGEEKRRTRIDP